MKDMLKTPTIIVFLIIVCLFAFIGSLEEKNDVDFTTNNQITYAK